MMWPAPRPRPCLRPVALATGPGGRQRLVLSVPAADLAAGVGVEAVAFSSGLEAREVGGPVGRAAVHELVLPLPALVAEQQRGAAVRPGLQREGDARVDPVLGTVDASPGDLVRAAFLDFEDCRRRLRGR